ncbi:MAG: twin-arginine translocation pathway signal protein [Deltaproteobacteria bacterium]|jgi:lipid-binding SYLF domain-containing protein|nr:MAG: twin-arginine translocation pathway signal protein [Deltaproteobacteria bacterium]
MMKYFRLTTILLVFAFTVGALTSPNPATAASAAEIDRDAQKALGDLYAKSSSAKTMGEKAIGILVFPGIVKGGFIVGGQYGEGALIKEGKTVAYYNTVAASYGLQAGLQKFGYALFFMTDSAVKWIDKSDGWEIGVGPSIVVVDAGAAASMTSTTLQSDIYAFFFDQKGLMAGIGLQGTKITKLGKTPPSD